MGIVRGGGESDCLSWGGRNAGGIVEGTARVKGDIAEGVGRGTLLKQVFWGGWGGGGGGCWS